VQKNHLIRVQKTEDFGALKIVGATRKKKREARAAAGEEIGDIVKKNLHQERKS